MGIKSGAENVNAISLEVLSTLQFDLFGVNVDLEHGRVFDYL